MTIDEMNKIKETRGYSFTQLSDYTGVPVVTLQRIFTGATKSPRKATLDAIEKVLKGDESIFSGKAYSYGEKSSVSYSDYEGKSGMLLENEPVYGAKKNGEYTVADYYALPDDKRVELIDGYFYDMTAPRTIHQIICDLVFNSIYNFIRENKGSCIPISSPIDVQLDCDDKTMVQPDIIIVCDEDKIKDRVVFGAPDLIIEILSPSTRRKDMFVKTDKYCNAGVKEYWMIDPKKKILIAYNFSDEDVVPVIVPLKGEFAMFMYDGKLKVNLDEIAQMIDRFTR
ncbi:Uma2 family endonuclease [Butyrivibrio sp. FC2001]|uniref:Uma2 family endonuclease n=1 Tax=Butyrivibrio sp. FC2001 TaxID=1280671 RepID=UPI0004008153|nr:Uma2 family endonuclease [Butyrivibrio sp. FC2001]